MDRRIIGGRYEVLEQIGAGGVAVVYLARDLTLGRLVAIKMLTAAAAADKGFVARFRREAQAIASLNHPNVVTVYDWGTADGTDYMVMEFIPGGNLAEFLAGRERLPEAEALAIAREIALGLARAHQEGIVHRDIKPHNILLDAAGRPKVADFGIAHAPGLTHLTQTNSVVGTASYISPEQAQGRTADERSDLYSLGVVLYEMLTGRPPFIGESLVDTAIKHVNEAPVPPRDARPDLTPETNALVMKALAKNPADRFPSAAAMADALAAAEAAQERRGAPTIAAPLAADAAMAPTTAVPRTLGRTARAPRPTTTSPHVSWIALPIAALLVALLAAAALAHPWTSHQVASAHHPTAGRVASSNPTATSAPTSVPPSARPTAPPATRSPATSVPATTAPAPVQAAPPAPATAQPPHAATPRPAGPPTEAAAARAGGAGTPSQAVVRFYTLVAEHRFAAAGALWTPSMQAAYPPNVNVAQRFANVQSITVNQAYQTALDTRAGTAAVYVSLTEVDTNRTYQLSGTWQLVNRGGGWLLNQPNFGNPNQSDITNACGKSDHDGCGSPPPHGHGHGRGPGD